ncbi:30S ribosomal protein S8 [Candidatus Micrarchaeota archaeon]|nr:30S ribosomal protein S8 [Candidatus Micrarchaeota archaeon]
MVNDTVADSLNRMKTHEQVGKKECIIQASKLMKEILKILQSNKYIGTYELIEEGHAKLFRIELVGRINKCSAIKPRFPVKKDEWTKWEQQYIPAIGFGMLIVSTPKGIMTNKEAKEHKVGGRIIAYIY